MDDTQDAEARVQLLVTRNDPFRPIPRKAEGARGPAVSTLYMDPLAASGTRAEPTLNRPPLKINGAGATEDPETREGLTDPALYVASREVGPPSSPGRARAP